MGLNFQTQTIINSNVDVDSNGKALIAEVESENGKFLQVKRDFQFYTKDAGKGYIKYLYKKAASTPEMCQVEINLTNIVTAPEEGTKKYMRLDVYLGVEGAEPYIYSTPFARKGIPFWTEFVVTSKDTPETVAKKIENILKKSETFRIDKDLITVEVDGAKITLTGNTEFQRFLSVKVLEFVDHEEEVVAELGDKNITLKAYGANGFGTYSHIIKDLRLPTAANYNWTHRRQAETPAVGALYTQYIITLVAPAVNDGIQAVGERMISETTHVFWVNETATSDGSTLLTDYFDGLLKNYIADAKVAQEWDAENKVWKDIAAAAETAE